MTQKSEVDVLPPGSHELREFIRVEEQRIASVDKRTSLGEKIIEAQESSDLRQYEYHREVLHIQKERDERNDNRAWRYLISLTGIAVLFIAINLYFIFQGSEDQLEIAKEILTTAFTVAGGGGLTLLLLGIFKILSPK